MPHSSLAVFNAETTAAFLPVSSPHLFFGGQSPGFSSGAKSAAEKNLFSAGKKLAL